MAALTAGADLAKGSRFARGRRQRGLHRLPARRNRALNGLVNLLCGTSYTDLNYGYKAFWRRCVPFMRAGRTGLEVEALTTVPAGGAGLVVREVPSFEWERLSQAGNLRAIRDWVRVLRVIGSERLLRRRSPA